MNTKRLLSLIFFFLSFQASAQSSKKTSLVKSKTFSSFSFKYTQTSLTYNRQGDITSRIIYDYTIDEDDNKDTVNIIMTENYTYHQDSITYKGYLPPLDPMSATFFLNSQKLLEKKDRKILRRNTHQYQYNNAGYLIYSEGINAKNLEPFYKSWYKYHQGNLIQSTFFFYEDEKSNTPTDTLITHYEYYLDKPNTIGNQNFGEPFLGKSSKNLLKSQWSKRDAKVTYLYTFDKKGRVIGMIEKDKPQGITSYEYYD